ncbi:hypothetical protein D3C77_182980 [compost metagenome]
MGWRLGDLLDHLVAVDWRALVEKRSAGHNIPAAQTQHPVVAADQVGQQARIVGVRAFAAEGLGHGVCPLRQRIIKEQAGQLPQVIEAGGDTLGQDTAQPEAQRAQYCQMLLQCVERIVGRILDLEEQRAVVQVVPVLGVDGIGVRNPAGALSLLKPKVEGI